MAHNKNRSEYAFGDVDWTNPQLSELLDKIDGLTLDQRTKAPPRPVQIRITTGWDAGGSDTPAMLVAQIDGTMVLATRSPLPHGGEVQISGLTGDGPSTRWGVVTDERQGTRSEDKGQDIYLNWLRPRR